MKISMTGQKNGDLLIHLTDCLIEVTTMAGLTVFSQNQHFQHQNHVSI